MLVEELQAAPNATEESRMTEHPSRARQPIFDGFPYLVTRIGRTYLRHIIVLPADLTREELADLARRQVEANRLDTCLCLGPADFLYFHGDGTEAEGGEQPWGVPVVGKLKPAEEFPDTPELARRIARLGRFVEEHGIDGTLVGDGLEAGRLATEEDVARLGRRDARGVRTSLERCPRCRRARGEWLALYGEGNGDKRPRVVFMHCRCDNHNLCARCGDPLAEDRLSSYSHDDATGGVFYAAAYMGLGHRCADEEEEEPEEEVDEELERAVREWLSEAKSLVDAEVERRSVAVIASRDLAAIRAFVETCVVALGRVPLPDETPAAWAGKDLAPDALDDGETRQQLGLEQDDERNGYRVRVFFNSPRVAAAGEGESEPGWYLVVLNPDDDWRFNEAVGPYESAEAAWEDAGRVHGERGGAED
jgi:hypothetical protein